MRRGAAWFPPNQATASGSSPHSKEKVVATMQTAPICVVQGTPRGSEHHRTSHWLDSCCSILTESLSRRFDRYRINYLPGFTPAFGG
jgi:hypothetical protein